MRIHERTPAPSLGDSILSFSLPGFLGLLLPTPPSPPGRAAFPMSCVIPTSCLALPEVAPALLALPCMFRSKAFLSETDMHATANETSCNDVAEVVGNVVVTARYSMNVRVDEARGSVGLR